MTGVADLSKAHFLQLMNKGKILSAQLHRIIGDAVKHDNCVGILRQRIFNLVGTLRLSGPIVR